MDRPIIEPTVEVGDHVEAGLNRDTDLPIIVTQFEVTQVTGTKVFGGPDQLGAIDTTEGWIVEVSRKGDPKLPTNLSYVAAAMVDAPAQPVKLIGHGDRWQIDGGGYVDAADVLAWMKWSDWEPLDNAWQAWKSAEMQAAADDAERPDGIEP